MKKKLILAGVILAALVGTWEFLKPQEPVYEGKRLSVWMRGLAYRGGPSTSDEAAIRRLGTNAIPSLLKVAKVRESLFYGLYVELNRRQSLIHFGTRTGDSEGRHDVSQVSLTEALSPFGTKVERFGPWESSKKSDCRRT